MLLVVWLDGIAVTLVANNNIYEFQLHITVTARLRADFPCCIYHVTITMHALTIHIESVLQPSYDHVPRQLGS
jgi:hypothetical protein